MPVAWSRLREGIVAGFRSVVDDPRRAAPLVTAVVVLAVVLRVLWASGAPFGYDLGNTYKIAGDIASGHAYPLIGAVASWGGRAPFPGFFYLVTPPLLVSASPVVFVRWGALLCALGLVPFALLLWERYGPRAAVFGTLLASTAPWLVIQGDSCWSPKLAVPIAALLFYCLHRVVAHERSRWAAVIPIAFALQAHVYPNLPPTLGAALAVWLVCRPRVNWRWFLLGCLIALLTAVPTAIHVARNGLDELKWDDDEPMSRGFEALDATYHTFVFSSSEVSYEMEHGHWGQWTLRRFVRGLPKSLVDAYGRRLSVFVVASVFVALACWMWALARGVLTLARRRWRTLDPMGVALVAGWAATVLLVAATSRPYLPRYNQVLIWLALLPPIWLVATRRRAGALLWPWLLLVVPLNANVVGRYYTRSVPPFGAGTMAAIIEKVSRDQGGKPFVLQYHGYGEPRRVTTVDVVARRMKGAALWQRVPRAEVTYFALPKKLSSAERRLFRVPRTRVFRVDRGILLRQRGAAATPDKRHGHRRHRRRPSPAPSRGS